MDMAVLIKTEISIKKIVHELCKFLGFNITKSQVVGYLLIEFWLPDSYSVWVGHMRNWVHEFILLRVFS